MKPIPRKVKNLIISALAALIFVLICLPGLIVARKEAHTSFCINNLMQIDAAKHTWAKENNKTSNDVPTWQGLQPYLGYGTNLAALACPDGGIYAIGRIGEAPKCSITNHCLN